MLSLPALVAASLFAAGPFPTTCVAALRSYGPLRELPVPYVVLELPDRADSAHTSDAKAADALLRDAARVGATGFAYMQVSESEITPAERRAMRDARVTRAPYRSVAVYVPADSARAQRSCGRVIRSY